MACQDHIISYWPLSPSHLLPPPPTVQNKLKDFLPSGSFERVLGSLKAHVLEGICRV